MRSASANLNHNANVLSLYSKFSWNVKNILHHGKGRYTGYAKATKLWADLHDMLDDSNSSSIPLLLIGMIARSQVCDYVHDQALNIDKDIIRSDNRAVAVVAVAYKWDAFSDDSDGHLDFTDFISAYRASKESFFNSFETH